MSWSQGSSKGRIEHEVCVRLSVRACQIHLQTANHCIGDTFFLEIAGQRVIGDFLVSALHVS